VHALTPGSRLNASFTFIDERSWTVLAGIDTHKDTLAVAVIDHAGRQLVTVEVPNTEIGFDTVEALLTAHRVSRVGIEGAGNYGRGVALRLVLAAAAEVVEVPPSLTSRERSAKPGQGKSDPVDAVAIARITAREASLPAVRLAVGDAADLRALAGYRAQLVQERTAVGNRVHAELHGLHPGYHARIPRLTNSKGITAAQELLESDTRLRAGLTRRRLNRLTALTGGDQGPRHSDRRRRAGPTHLVGRHLRRRFSSGRDPAR